MPEGFIFTPENASGENVMGEGHAHIYVDGVKLGRVYSNWYHLGGLSSGTREVKVNLNTNDHHAYGVEGVEVSATATVVVE